MPETTKIAEPARKTQDSTARTGQATVDTATKIARETMEQNEKIAQSAADQGKEAAHTMTETIAEVTDTATTVSSKVAEQSREMMFMGVRTAADVSGRVADIGFGRGHHLLASAIQAMDIYRDASERSAERVQSLFSSCVTLGRGLQEIQQAWLEMLDRSMEHAAHKPQDLLRCKTIVEMAEVQRDLYVDAINHAIESSSRLLDLAGRTAQDAVRPLQIHHH
ncbi:MAG: phasin family protein [Rhodopila sp.]|nr:phasin family protein [Rhodopila sp.]